VGTNNCEGRGGGVQGGGGGIPLLSRVKKNVNDQVNRHVMLSLRRSFCLGYKQGSGEQRNHQEFVKGKRKERGGGTWGGLINIAQPTVYARIPKKNRKALKWFE